MSTTVSWEGSFDSQFDIANMARDGEDLRMRYEKTTERPIGAVLYLKICLLSKITDPKAPIKFANKLKGTVTR